MVLLSIGDDVQTADQCDQNLAPIRRHQFGAENGSYLSQPLHKTQKDCVNTVEVTIREGTVVAKAGSSVILPCSYSTTAGSNFVLEWKFASGNTLPSNGRQIYYYFNGVSYKPGSQSDRLSISQSPPTQGTASILLSDIRASDNGSYVCQVNNPPDFSGTGSGIVKLTVLVPPTSPNCQMVGNPIAGYDLTLKCSSSGGNPAPIYAWTFVGSKTPLLTGMMENQRTGSLLLTNLSQALSGSYMCTASNELGKATCDLTLSVTGAASSGAIAGAVVGVLLALLLVAAIVFIFLRYRKKQRKVPNAEYPGNEIREDAASPMTQDEQRRSYRTGSSLLHSTRGRDENMVV
ncbi:V-set and immunoglobulin domain-containing protein 2 [Pelodytes ibericus]